MSSGTNRKKPRSLLRGASLTEAFLRHLRKKKGLAASTVNRILATLKHAAQWIHRQRPFLVGEFPIQARARAAVREKYRQVQVRMGEAS